MNSISKTTLLLGVIAIAPAFAGAAGPDSLLFKDAVVPILNAKCVACHGPDKQKGKLRLDSPDAILKGSDGENIIPGKVEDSLLTHRVLLPGDDDEHMPPSDEAQLTKEEIEVLKFWVASGAKTDAKIADLKPAGDVAKAIDFVLANPPKATGTAAAKPTVDPKVAEARAKTAAEVIGKVEKEGASLMAIAQDTPDLRFSALNVAKDYGDKHLETLKPVAEQVKWMDIARTQVTDAGLANIVAMKNLTRLHLENTKVGDAGLDHVKGLASLEYLNLYGTGVTDAGIAKLSGLKNLKKIFVWQTKVTEAGAKKLAAAVPGLDVNTGWKEPAKPVAVAATTPAAPAPAKPATPAPATPAKPATPTATPAKPATPAPTPAKPATPTATPAKPATPAPTPAKPVTPTPAPVPAKPATPAPAAAIPPAAPAASAQAVAALTSKVDAATAAANDAKKVAGEAKAAADAAAKAAGEATKAAQTANQVAGQLKAALEQLQKAAAALSAPPAKK